MYTVHGFVLHYFLVRNRTSLSSGHFDIDRHLSIFSFNSQQQRKSCIFHNYSFKVCEAACELSFKLCTCMCTVYMDANINVRAHTSGCMFAHMNVCEGKSDCVSSSICLSMCSQLFACVHVCMCLCLCTELLWLRPT